MADRRQGWKIAPVVLSMAATATAVGQTTQNVPATQEATAIRAASSRPSGSRAGRSFTWDELNLRSTNFPVVWRQGPSVRRARLAFTHSYAKSEMYVQVENTADEVLTLEKVGDQIASHLGNLLGDGKIIQREARQGLGMPGIHLEATGFLPDGTEAVDHAWIGLHRGRIYSVQVVAEQRSSVAAHRDLGMMVDSLQLIDAEKKFEVEPAKPIEYFASRVYGYGIVMPKDGGWGQWADVQAICPAADFGTRIGTDTFLYVAPIPVGKFDGTEEAVVDALLAMTSLQRADLKEVQPFESGKLKGHRAISRALFEGRQMHSRIVTLRGDGYAVLCVGTSARPEMIKSMDEVIAGIQFGKLYSVDADGGLTLARTVEVGKFRISLMTEVQRRGVSLVINQLGLERFVAQDQKTAATLFRRALDFSPDPLVFANLIESEFSSGQTAAAVASVREATRAFPTHAKLLRLAASVAYRNGLKDESLQFYRRLLNTGAVDDVAFADWADLMIEMGKVEEALKSAVIYQGRSKSESAALTHVHLLLSAKRHEEAVKVLEARPFTPALGIPLARAYMRVERYADALKSLDRMGDQSSNVDQLMIRGLVLMGLKQDAKAKACFDRAAVLRPNDPEIVALVQAAGAQTGQGNNAAVRTEIAPVEVPAELAATPAMPADIEASAGAVYLSSVRAIEFQPGKPLRTTDYHTIRILNARGAEEFNSLNLPLDPNRERLFVNRLEVFDEKGTLLARGRPEDSYVLDTPTREYATLEQQLHVPVPALRPGCEVRLAVTRERRSPAEAFEFMEHPFWSTMPRVRSALFVRGATDKIAVREFSGVTSREVAGGRLWQVDPTPTLVYEPQMDNPREFMPTVVLSDPVATWAKEGETYLAAIQERLGADAEVKALAAQVTAGIADPTEKLKAITRHVQGCLSYKAIAFGRRAWVPNTTESILRNRFGDCKDHSLLLHLMLREAGIGSHLALVSTGSPVLADRPSSDQFDHMIVYVPDCGGKPWWIDGTVKRSNAAGPRPYGLTEGEALILSESPGLVRIPVGGTSGYRIERRLAISVDGEMRVSDRIVIRGELAGSYRTVIQETDPASRRAALSKMFFMDVNAVRAVEASVEGLEAIGEPLVIAMNYTVSQKLRVVGQRLIGELPTQIERGLVQGDPVERRRSPFKVSMPIETVVDLAVTLPAGWSVDGWDEEGPREFADDFLVARIGRTVGADARLHADVKVDTKAGTYPAERYQAFVESRQAVLEAWSVPIIVKKGKAAP